MVEAEGPGSPFPQAYEVVLVQRGSLPNTDAPQVPRLRQAPRGLTWLDGAGRWQKPPQWWSSKEHEAKPGWGAPRPLKWTRLPEQLPKEHAHEQRAQLPGWQVAPRAETL